MRLSFLMLTQIINQTANSPVSFVTTGRLTGFYIFTDHVQAKIKKLGEEITSYYVLKLLYVGFLVSRGGLGDLKRGRKRNIVCGAGA